VILSKLSEVDRITHYYDRLKEIIPRMEQVEQESKAKISRLGEAWADVPVLSGNGDN
jgi:hypothetical protein